ncbi:two-component sensor histidine kinase [Helicobacter valdiviensis]|uniref:histidine kinase n=1 Tax=Helicobacter valdiviensis TaxID=1458358 RepID=A0A2W6MS75_9HELI|nr:ArsS family sensor histidine kinase [Helicobacter valdiviensis]PZT47405.1 two-component sensor histidine kinase [Helicobacter valdiviensis]
MIRNSIIIKITILFIAAIVGLSAFSYYFIREEINKEIADNQLRYSQFLTTINQLVRFGDNVELIEKYLYELGLTKITNTHTLEKFENQALPNLTNGIIAKIIKEEEGFYLFLQTPFEWKVYGDIHSHNLINYYIITFTAFLIVIFLFVLVIKSILPLNILRKKIRRFAEGQQNITFSIPQNDEIGELAREFDNAVMKINALNQSRHLFLRSIMHELKTPITKGRITAEMIDNALYKERLCSVFERLNSLINEFAKIEELSSRNYCLNKQNYKLQEVLQKVFKMLLVEEDQISSLFILPKEEYYLRCDFEMLTLAIKNLLDNALKYKSEGLVEIKIEENDLMIVNYAPPLPYTLKDHSKPFFKDKNSSKNGGLGLGIYIIKSTLEAQELVLDYLHKNNQNIFSIKGVISKKQKGPNNV